MLQTQQGLLYHLWKGPRCCSQKLEQISEPVIAAQRQPRDRHWHTRDERRNREKKICKRLDFPVLNIFVAIQPCQQLLSLRNLWVFAFLTVLKVTKLFSMSSTLTCNRNWKSCYTDSMNSVSLINIDISYLDFKAICAAILHHSI